MYRNIEVRGNEKKIDFDQIPGPRQIVEIL